MRTCVENLYVHVPFCVRKCGYCDFFSVDYNEKLTNRYLNALEKEIQFYGEKLHALKTVYIGGGTPSVLSDDRLERLMEIITNNVIFAYAPPSTGGKDGIESGNYGADYEFTTEVNPGTLNAAKLDIFRKYSVNRLSIGVQSLDDRLLSFLGRIHTAHEAVCTIELVKNSFENYSVDLIYGIPGQDLAKFEKTLQKIISYSPPHISAYELTPEKGTPLSRDIEEGRVEMPREGLIVQMYDYCSRALSDQGFHHYEVSNYARPGYESRHNLNYWRRGTYIGIGPSAHSFHNGKRSKNVVNIEDYCRNIEKETAILEEVIELSPLDEIRETVFLGLRTSEGIDVMNVIERIKPYLEHVADLRSFVDIMGSQMSQNLICLEGSRLFLTERGFILSSSLILEVLRALGL